MMLNISLRLKERREPLLAKGSSAALTATIVLLLAVSPAHSLFAERWTAEAVPPRPTLPTVTVELGEPGGYVPVLHSYEENVATPPFTRITLTAVNGEYPFDGYIGYDFVVGKIGTRDIPVIARAVLAPGERWSFSTFLHVISGPIQMSRRELAVHWADRTTRRIARVSVGIPPWAKQRVLLVNETAPVDHAGSAFGSPAYTVRPSGLSDVSQWYAGFSSLVIPTNIWLALPLRVREAIFGSEIYVTFVGVPAKTQQLTSLDRAMLPVGFSPAEGSYEMPWPYGTGRVSTSHTWKPKRGSFASSEGESPFLVESPVARYVADASFLDRPRAFLGRSSLPNEKLIRKPPALPLMRAAVEIRPLVAAVVALPLSIVSWFLIRRRRVGLALAVALPLTVLVLVQRDWLHLRNGTRVVDRVVARTGDVASRQQWFTQFGESPLGELHLPSEGARTRLAGRGDVFEDAEIRTPRTPPGFGKMIFNRSAWDSTSRWTRSNQLANVSGISVVRRSPQQITLRIPASLPSEYVEAQWLVDGIPYRGESRAASGNDREVEVQAGHWIPELNTNQRSFDWAERFTTDSVRVRLMDDRGLVTREVVWRQPLQPEELPHFRVRGVLQATPASSVSKTLFTIPAAAFMSRSVFVVVSGVDANRVLTVSGERGSVGGIRVDTSKNYESTFDVTDALRHAVGRSGFFEVSVSTGSGLQTDRSHIAYVVVKEKSS